MHPMTGNITSVLEGVWSIDVGMYGISGLSSVYVVAGDRLAIIDAGTPSSAGAILDGINMIGRKRDDVAFVALSHIHPDHAGGASQLMGKLLEARLAVHWKAAKHMADPSRLVASIKKFGAAENSQELEKMGPIEESRIIPVRDGHILDLGQGRKLSVMETPGHAPHELSLFEERSRVLFVGDTLGVMTDGNLLLPNAVLPDFDLAQSVESTRRLKGFNAQALAFAHFGVSFRVVETLDRAMDNMMRWEEIGMQAARHSGLDSVVQVLENYGRQQIQLVRRNGPLYDHLHSQLVPMIAAAYAEHCKRRLSVL